MTLVIISIYLGTMKSGCQEMPSVKVLMELVLKSLVACQVVDISFVLEW